MIIKQACIYHHLSLYLIQFPVPIEAGGHTLVEHPRLGLGGAGRYAVLQISPLSVRHCLLATFDATVQALLEYQAGEGGRNAFLPHHLRTLSRPYRPSRPIPSPRIHGHGGIAPLAPLPSSRSTHIHGYVFYRFRVSTQVEVLFQEWSSNLTTRHHVASATITN